MNNVKVDTASEWLVLVETFAQREGLKGTGRDQYIKTVFSEYMANVHEEKTSFVHYSRIGFFALVIGNLFLQGVFHMFTPQGTAICLISYAIVIFFLTWRFNQIGRPKAEDVVWTEYCRNVRPKLVSRVPGLINPPPP